MKFRIVKTSTGMYAVGFDAPDGMWMQHSCWGLECVARETCDKLNEGIKPEQLYQPLGELGEPVCVNNQERKEDGS